MAKSPLILAALAKDAVPQLNFVRAVSLDSGDGGHFDSALLTADSGEHFVLKQARSEAAALDLDTELVVLRALNPYRSHFPFEITKLVGETRDAKGRRAHLFSYVYGQPADLQDLPGTSPLAGSLANTLAAIHSLPLSVVENSGLPVYSPEATVREGVSAMDRLAQSGRIPALLLNRWERAFEDVNLWRFQPAVLHGHGTAGNFLEQGGEITGVLNWYNAQAGDPAHDFAWIVGFSSEDFAYSVLLEYDRLRGNDANLRARAQLYSEMDLAHYLVDSILAGDEVGIQEGQAWIDQLIQNIENGIVGPIGPKPLGIDSFGTSEALGSAAGFVSVAQEMVSDSHFSNDDALPTGTMPAFLSEDGFDSSDATVPASGFAAAPELLSGGDPAEVRPSSDDLFRPVVDSSYNHKNLFGETGPLDIPGFLAEEPVDDATAPIQIVSEDEKKTNDLF